MIKQKESYIQRAKPKEHTCELCGKRMKIQAYGCHFKNKHDMISEEYFNSYPNHLIKTFIPKNYITVKGVVVSKSVIKSTHKKMSFKNITQLKRWLLIRVFDLKGPVSLSFVKDSFYDRYTNKEWLDKLEKVLSSKFSNQSHEYAVLRWDKEVADIKLSKKSAAVTGDNNPGYQHGGRLSPFSEKFFKYKNGEADYTIEDVKCKRAKSVVDNPQNQHTRIEYYLNQGMVLEDAEKALTEHQRTFSFDKCIEKHGYIDGYNIWKKRQDKWLKTLNSKSDKEKDRINMAKGSGRINQLFKSDPEIKNIPAILYYLRFYDSKEKLNSGRLV